MVAMAVAASCSEEAAVQVLDPRARAATAVMVAMPELVVPEEA
jgi:hypothetical protein